MGKTVDKPWAGGVAADGFATKFGGRVFKDREGVKNAVGASGLDGRGDHMKALLFDTGPDRPLALALAVDGDPVKAAGGRLLLEPIGQAFPGSRD